MNKQIYHIGQIFALERTEYEKETMRSCYIVLLCQTIANRCSLICLDDGNRWTNPIEIMNTNSITKEEMLRMSGEREFHLIKDNYFDKKCNRLPKDF